MLPLLNKVFVRQFYAANTGFFLFFFFIFFGSVSGGTLVSYHLSLMNSTLTSSVTLVIVLTCWSMYHAKCVAFFLKKVSQETGTFLYAIQAVKKRRQLPLLGFVYLSVYLPVFIYSILLSVYGFERGFTWNAILIILFQAMSLTVSIYIIYSRLNNWITASKLPSIHFSTQKSIFLLCFFYFVIERRTLLLVLKSVSLLLLYITLVWNKGKYDNDSFVLFYLVILLSHSALPYFAVHFMENNFTITRSLPIPKIKRLTMFIFAYIILLLPELIYILYQATAFSIEIRLAFYINLVIALGLLTAIQYSGSSHRNEFVKASFGLLFFSLFALHIQAFWSWILIQLSLMIVLFWNGYYSLESTKG